MNCTKNEDDLEEAEMRLLQRQLDQGKHVTESQEEKDYKAEFFELLDEVNSLTTVPAPLLTAAIIFSHYLVMSVFL